MDEELIDRTWSILPKEFKEEVKEIYSIAITYHPRGYNHKTDLLKYLFGRHNLTSDAEGEEILTCEKYKVEEALNYCDELDSISGSHNMINWGKQMIVYLFGSKCLIDAHEDNFTSIEPKPAEPKEKSSNSTELKSQEVDKHFDTIIKDGFREHNRLHIAAMAMAGILSYGDLADPDEVTDMAIIYADELIEKCEKGEGDV